MAQTATPSYYKRRLSVYIKELWRRREFIWFLAVGNFKARNASTSLGLFWWVLNPILLSLVYWLVFSIVFVSDRDIVYVMSGMFAFHFTTQSLTGGANSILQNSKLLTNFKFPRSILPRSNPQSHDKVLNHPGKLIASLPFSTTYSHSILQGLRPLSEPLMTPYLRHGFYG